MGSAEKHDVGVLLGTGDGAGRQGIARITMKENDFGMESGKSKETLRGLKKLAAVGSIAAAAFSLSACEGTASAEQSGGQSGGTVASEGSTVCNTETGAVVAKKDGMDPSVFKDPSVCETITPAPVSTEVTTPKPSETQTLETDSDWVDKEFLQKISIDYDSFDGWDEMDVPTKLDTCLALFYNNGMKSLTIEDQSLDSSVHAMSGQEIVDYWNKQNAIVWSVVNDRSDERNGDIAKKLSWCTTSDRLSGSEYEMQQASEETIDYILESDLITEPVAAPYIFGEVTKQSPRYFMAMSAKDGPAGWDEYAIEAEVTMPSAFGDSKTEVQAIFEMQWSGYGPIWRLAAQKDIAHGDESDITTDVSKNLEPVE